MLLLPCKQYSASNTGQVSVPPPERDQYLVSCENKNSSKTKTQLCIKPYTPCSSEVARLKT